MFLFCFSEVPVVTWDRAPPLFWSLREDVGVRAINAHLSSFCSVPSLLPATPLARKESGLEEQCWHEQMTHAGLQIPFHYKWWVYISIRRVLVKEKEVQRVRRKIICSIHTECNKEMLKSRRSLWIRRWGGCELCQLKWQQLTWKEGSTSWRNLLHHFLTS